MELVSNLSNPKLIPQNLPILLENLKHVSILYCILPICMYFFRVFYNPKKRYLILLVAFIEYYLILVYYDLVFHAIPILCIFLLFFLPKTREMFLVDFSCYKPPSFCRIPFSSFIEHAELADCFHKESVDLMSKILHSSGLGPETYLPPSLHFIPPTHDHSSSTQEAQMVLFTIMEDLLMKCKLSPLDIDFLIVNCSGFCPSPSLSSIVVSKFKMRHDVRTFNLSGMGCSASGLAVGFVEKLLLVNKESNAVILSTEILTMGWYSGNEKPKLALNCLFRMGGAAILLTNRKKVQNGPKYKVVWALRDQRADHDKAYNSAIREEDANGLIGVTIRKDILDVASGMIRSQLTALGSHMLPITEKVKFATSVVNKRYLNKGAEIYLPNFKTIVQHFCLPVSGRVVIQEIGKGLRLGEREMEAAYATLHRFGNQSSSSLWYELAYMEAKEKVKKGDRVWMLGMGTGPKCSSIVLECIRPIRDESTKGPWADCIHRYPACAFDNN